MMERKGSFLDIKNLAPKAWFWKCISKCDALQSSISSWTRLRSTLCQGEFGVDLDPVDRRIPCHGNVPIKVYSVPEIKLPKGNSQRKLVFQPSVFRCYVSFREGRGISHGKSWVSIQPCYFTLTRHPGDSTIHLQSYWHIHPKSTCDTYPLLVDKQSDKEFPLANMWMSLWCLAMQFQ